MQMRKANNHTRLATAVEFLTALVSTVMELAPNIDNLTGDEPDFMFNVSKRGAAISLGLAAVFTAGLAYCHYCVYLLNQDEEEELQEIKIELNELENSSLSKDEDSLEFDYVELWDEVNENRDEIKETQGSNVDTNNANDETKLEVIDKKKQKLPLLKRFSIFADKVAHGFEKSGAITLVLDAATHNHINRFAQFGINGALLVAFTYATKGESQACKRHVGVLHNENVEAQKLLKHS